MQLNIHGDDFSLTEAEMAKPSPGKGEILIKVMAAGVTPSEVYWYPTSHTPTGAERKNTVPCHEFSGMVEAMGDGVEGYEIGQEVCGMNDWFSHGALAEFCITKPEWIVSKPSRLTHQEAASMPISALTAWQGLFTHGKLESGETVLIHGGSGSVGSLAVQLAHNKRAEVIATCSKSNKESVRGLGADLVVDYKTQRFEEITKEIDLVFDTVGGDTLERSWSLLGSRGRLVTVASQSATDESSRVKEAFFIVATDSDQLSELSTLIDKNLIQPQLGTVVPIDQSEPAFKGTISKSIGKTVITNYQ